MSGHTLDRELLAFVGHHARTVHRGFSYPPESLVASVKVCPVCCGPMTAEYALCYQCHDRRSTFHDQLADIVVPVSYAVRGNSALQQFYTDLHQYKADRPSAAAQNRLKALLLLFRLHHLECLEQHVGLPVQAVIPVPSGKNRVKHPLPDIASMLTAPMGDLRGYPLLSARFVGQPRTSRVQRTNPDDFAIDQRLAGHVVIVEDTWVQGHNAQSLAIQAKRRGASKVSIVVLARMLDYAYPPTKTMVDTWPSDAHFDPHVCPMRGTSH